MTLDLQAARDPVGPPDPGPPDLRPNISKVDDVILGGTWRAHVMSDGGFELVQGALDGVMMSVGPAAGTRLRDALCRAMGTPTPTQPPVSGSPGFSTNALGDRTVFFGPADSVTLQPSGWLKARSGVGPVTEIPIPPDAVTTLRELLGTPTQTPPPVSGSSSSDQAASRLLDAVTSGVRGTDDEPDVTSLPFTNGGQVRVLTDLRTTVIEVGGDRPCAWTRDPAQVRALAHHLLDVAGAMEADVRGSRMARYVRNAEAAAAAAGGAS